LKIAIDILTPKQCMLFSKLSEKLENRGHQIFKTTRRYREVLQLLRLKGVDARVVGEHGGKKLIDKLKASAQRTLELASLFEEISPDVAISFSSPEMTRVSYGLKVPHICGRNMEYPQKKLYNTTLLTLGFGLKASNLTRESSRN